MKKSVATYTKTVVLEKTYEVEIEVDEDFKRPSEYISESDTLWKIADLVDKHIEKNKVEPVSVEEIDVLDEDLSYSMEDE